MERERKKKSCIKHENIKLSVRILIIIGSLSSLKTAVLLAPITA